MRVMRPDDAAALREWLVRELTAADVATQKRNAPAMQRAIERAAVQLAEYVELGLLSRASVERLRVALATYDRERDEPGGV